MEEEAKIAEVNAEEIAEEEEPEIILGFTWKQVAIAAAAMAAIIAAVVCLIVCKKKKK